MLLSLDCTELPLATRQALHRHCTDENAVAMTLAKIRQQKVAQFWHQNGSRSYDGIGAQVGAIDPYYLAYFKMKYGCSATHDADFMKWLNRKEDMFKIKSTGTKAQVGYVPSALPKSVKHY